MSSLKLGVGGVWANPSNIRLGVNGSWVAPSKIYAGAGGAWVQVWPLISVTLAQSGAWSQTDITYIAATVTGGSGNYSYSWVLGSTWGDGVTLVDVSGATAQIRPGPAAIAFEMTLTVTDQSTGASKAIHFKSTASGITYL